MDNSLKRATIDGAAVIFDLDGTLVDTAGDLAAAMNHVLEGLARPPLPLDEVRHLVGSGARALIARGLGAASADDVDPREMEGHVETFLAFYTANIAGLSRPFPGAVEAMDRLAQAGAAFAICTNKREAPARQLLEALNLSRYFKAVVGADTTIASKPDPAPLRLCMEVLGVERGVFIGDSDTDIAAARAGGLACLLHENGYGPVARRNEIAAAFNDYRDLPGLAGEALAS